MLEHRMQEILSSLLSAAVTLPKRQDPPRLHAPLAIGFDTEWDPDTDGHPLLSAQLALPLGERWVLRVFDPPCPRLQVADLLRFAREVLDEAKVEVPADRRGVRRIRFVAHFAQAELSMFEDPFRDFPIEKINKSHHVFSLPVVDDEGDQWRLSLFDTFAIYAVGLAKVGKLIGLPKIDVDRTKLAELKRVDPEQYTQYAARDAQIPVAAYLRLRDSILQEFDIDIWRLHSLASISGQIFKYRFLRASPTPIKKMPKPENRQSAKGWRRAERQVEVFNGDRDVRLAACLAYWGGRAEAFVQGLIRGPHADLDVVSLYPYSAQIQPLPVKSTRWREAISIREVLELEGFGRFKFSFPKGFRYPSLPVKAVNPEALVFPLRGQADCTFAEIRAAVELGAEVRVVRAWGFAPGPREIDHDVGRFMREFLDRKARATKGTLEYETAKLIVNSLIGKFCEIRHGDSLLSFEYELRQAGVEAGFTREIANCAPLRAALKMESEAGSLFVPEWASLILGRSRALMAPIVAAGAILVSTDGVVLPLDVANHLIAPDTTNPALLALRAVGSDLRLEGQADAVFVCRARQYVLLKRPENVNKGDRVFYQDNEWTVVRVARHGTRESEGQFAETVLNCLRVGRDVSQPRERTRLIAGPEAIRRGVPINAEIIEERKTHFHWDNKRRLLNRDVNPFTSMSETSPYQTVGRMKGGRRLREVKKGTQRPQRIRRSKAKLEQVMELILNGKGAREIARRTGVPRSTVQDMIAKVPPGERQP